MSAVSKVFTQTIPARIRRARRCARLTSRVHRPAARPYGESLAMAIASVLVLELGHGQDRPEDLLARDPHRVGDAIEDGRAGCSSRRSPRGPARHRRPGRPPRPARARRSRGPWRAGARRPSSRASCADRAAHRARASARAPRSARRAPRGPSDGRPAASRRCRSGRCCRRSPSRSRSPPSSRSPTSARTTCGLLPPSSSEIAFTSDSPTARSSDRPTSVEPGERDLVDARDDAPGRRR